MDEKLIEIFATVFLTIIFGVLICRVLPFDTETNAILYLSGVIVGIAAIFLLNRNVQ